MISVSLFLFESLKENFHIVWVFSPMPGGYIPNKLNHRVETQVFLIRLILLVWWQGESPLMTAHLLPCKPSTRGEASEPLVPFSRDRGAGGWQKSLALLLPIWLLLGKPIHLFNWTVEISPKPYTMPGMFVLQAYLFLSNPPHSLLKLCITCRW